MATLHKTLPFKSHPPLSPRVTNVSLNSSKPFNVCFKQTLPRSNRPLRFGFSPSHRFVKLVPFCSETEANVTQQEAEETQIEDNSDGAVAVEDAAAAANESSDVEGASSSAISSLLQSYKEALASNDESKAADIEALFQSIEDEKVDLEKKMASLLEEITEEKIRVLRINADFDNFRKRTERERLSLVSNAQGEVLENLLPVLDNFERAKAQLKIETEGEEKINNSYQSIYKQFMEILASLGVEPVNAAGNPFDPMAKYRVGSLFSQLHEAIMRARIQLNSKKVSFFKNFARGYRWLKYRLVPGLQSLNKESSENADVDETTKITETVDSNETVDSSEPKQIHQGAESMKQFVNRLTRESAGYLIHKQEENETCHNDEKKNQQRKIKNEKKLRHIPKQRQVATISKLTEKGLELPPEELNNCTEGTKRCHESEDDLIHKQKKQKTEDSGKKEKTKKKLKDDKKDPTARKFIQMGLEPPPDMPQGFEDRIQNLGGTGIKLIIQKFIQVTDLSTSHNRFSMSLKQVRYDEFLNEAEKDKLNKKEPIEVVFVEPCGEVSTLNLNKWEIGASWSYVLNGTGYKNVVKNSRNNLKPKVVVQIWSFRVGTNSKLGFAMIKVNDGEDGEEEV